MKIIRALSVFIGIVAVAPFPADAGHITVAEACEECVLPSEFEQIAGGEVLADAYFLEYPAPELAALVHRFLARDAGSVESFLIDHVVFHSGKNGSGPIIRIVSVGEDGSFLKYEMRRQELVELLSLIQQGKEWEW